MKRTAYLCAAVLLSVFLSGMFVSAKTGWKGVVIYIDASSVMVKSGDYEKIFLLDKDTAVKWSASLSSKNKNAAALELCQTVSVDYVTEKSNLKAKSFVITKESDCYK